MKAGKGNIGRYYFFHGNFSSLWAIQFSFPLKKKILACSPQFTSTAETWLIKPSIVCLLIEKKVGWNYEYVPQGAKKIIFTACHSGKLNLAFTNPDVISTSPKNFLICRIDFTVHLLFEFLKKHHLPIRQVKNRIHWPDGKIHYPWAIRHYFLCTLRHTTFNFFPMRF